MAKVFKVRNISVTCACLLNSLHLLYLRISFSIFPLTLCCMKLSARSISALFNNSKHSLDIS